LLLYKTMTRRRALRPDNSVIYGIKSSRAITIVQGHSLGCKHLDVDQRERLLHAFVVGRHGGEVTPKTESARNVDGVEGADMEPGSRRVLP
jgi:hypothetical protein